MYRKIVLCFINLQLIPKELNISLKYYISYFRIIAEETVAAMQKMPELTDAPTWFLDPLDGTINFMHSFPYFSISIALMVSKVLVLGIIYNPSNSEFYSAIKGKGVFLNGKPIHVSNITGNAQAILSILYFLKY